MHKLLVLGVLAGLILAGCAEPTETESSAGPAAAVNGTVEVPVVEGGSEDELLARFPQVASRNGDVLTLTLNNGQTLRFENKDTGDESAVFTYFNGVIRGTSFALLQHALWEGSSVSLVHLGSGETVHLDVFPTFSPDAQWFFTASFDVVAGYNPNRIAVYRVTESGATLAWERGTNDIDWGPDEARWVDAQTLAYTRVAVEWQPDGTQAETRTAKTVRLVNGEWVEQ